MTIISIGGILSLGAGSSLPVAPADPSHLTMWYRADVLRFSNSPPTTPSVVDGDRVSVWEDIQSSGHNATALGTRRPTLRTAISGFNGKPVIDFDQSVNQFFTLDTVYVAALTEGEQFIVLKQKNDPPSAFGTSGAVVAMSNGGGDSYLPNTSGNLTDGFGSTSNHSIGAGGGGWAAAARLYNSYSKTNDWQAFVDGTSVFSTATNTVAFSAALFWGPYLGADHNTGFGFHGYIAEYLFYDHKLTAPDRALVTAYLKLRYGIP